MDVYAVDELRRSIVNWIKDFGEQYAIKKNDLQEWKNLKDGLFSISSDVHPLERCVRTICRVFEGQCLFKKLEDTLYECRTLLEEDVTDSNRVNMEILCTHVRKRLRSTLLDLCQRYDPVIVFLNELKEDLFYETIERAQDETNLQDAMNIINKHSYERRKVISDIIKEVNRHNKI